MWETYGNYIISYVIVGFVYFLFCYGVSFRVMTKFNKNSIKRKMHIKWGELIFLDGIFWPLGVVMEIVKIISTIGV